MKKLRRIIKQRRRQLDRALSALVGRQRPSHALPAIEAMTLFLGLLIAMTAGRSTMFRLLGVHADVWALVGVFGLFGLARILFNDRFASALDRRFAPNLYDDRRILFDLGEAARAITSMAELFALVVTELKTALNVKDVAIFVAEDESGDFVCRVQPSVEGAASRPIVLGQNAFIVKRLNNLSGPLGLGANELDSWERAISSLSTQTKSARLKEIEILRELRSRLFVQVMMRNKLVGLISLGERTDGRNFTPEDKQLLVAVAGQMAFIIEHSKLVGHIVEEERLHRELELATEVQQRLFPECAPESQKLSLAGYCRPAREVGGDYYDFLKLDDNQIGLAVADVAGKGIAAALLMSIMQASLRSQASAQRRFAGSSNSPAELVDELNRLLWRSTSAASYATFFYAQFDEESRRLTYVNAGHNPPLLIRARPVVRRFEHELATLQLAGKRSLARSTVAAAESGFGYRQVLTMPAVSSEIETVPVCERLSTGGLPLGLFESSRYEDVSIELGFGDLLVAYTDGLTEALNSNGEEFGEERLRLFLSSLHNHSAEEVRIALVEYIGRWCAGVPQHDDLTFIVIKAE